MTLKIKQKEIYFNFYKNENDIQEGKKFKKSIYARREIRMKWFEINLQKCYQTICYRRSYDLRNK